MAAAYVPRLQERHLADLVASAPAVLIQGPRAAGKTTLASRVARTVVQLDEPSTQAAFEADPDALLAEAPEPVLLDEWQEAPSVMGAVKRAVDRDPHPGRFVLTGSVSRPSPAATWPGTGRIVTLTVRPFVERELSRGAGVFSAILGREPLPVRSTEDNLVSIVDRAMSSGFPAIRLASSQAVRRQLLSGYVEQVTLRDAPSIGIRDVASFRRLVVALAGVTATVTTDQTLIAAFGGDRRTLRAYESTLEDLYLLEALPAWHTNRLKRLTNAAKRHLTDVGLSVGILELDRVDVLREGALLGRLIESFVVAQIRAEAEATDRRVELFHLRTKEGRQEVDLIAETNEGIHAFQITASAAPTLEHARHLEWLADEIGDAYIGGYVLHSGSRSYPLGSRARAIPISWLWA